MRLDQARIAIRERSWLDNLDLALHVIRQHAAAVLGMSLVGVLPMIAVNYLVIDYLLGTQLAEEASFYSVLWGTMLVMTEAPLVTAPLTLYLGQALFVEVPSGRQVARDFWHCLPQLLLFQGLLRGALILPIVTWFVPYGLWPNLNEVILLERTPLVGRNGQFSTAKRSSLLHRNLSGDLVIRALGAGLLSMLLILALWASQAMLLQWLFGFVEGWTAEVISFQAVLWIVAVYFTVARFLSYLDLRIRGEGWEVELCLRAQRERMTRHAV